MNPPGASTPVRRMPAWLRLSAMVLVVIGLLGGMTWGVRLWGDRQRGTTLTTEFQGLETNSMGQRCLVFGVRNHTRRTLELHAWSPKALSGDSASVGSGDSVQFRVAIGTNAPPYLPQVRVLAPVPRLLTRVIQWIERRKGNRVEGVFYTWAELPLPEPPATSLQAVR